MNAKILLLLSVVVASFQGVDSNRGIKEIVSSVQKSKAAHSLCWFFFSPKMLCSYVSTFDEVIKESWEDQSSTKRAPFDKESLFAKQVVWKGLRH